MPTIVGGLEMVAPLAVALTLWVMGRLSKRLGVAAHIPARHRGFNVAAFLLLIAAAARVINGVVPMVPSETLSESLLWVGLLIGLPAAGLTIGVWTAWRCWSWLLAERD